MACLPRHGKRLLQLGLRSFATSVGDESMINVSKRASLSRSKFWETVAVTTTSTGYVVALDGRPIKTPSNNVLEIPFNRRMLAALIAHEWDSQEKAIKTHALPMTSLATIAVDMVGNEPLRTGVIQSILRYLDTDTICFHDKDPPYLVSLQEKHWVPIIDWIRSNYSVDILTFHSVLQGSQPNTTRNLFEGVLARMDHWQLTAMERATYTSKSFLIALALVQRRLSVEDAAKASQVEVDSQIQRWGEVEDSHDVDFQDVRRLLGSAAAMMVQS